MKNNQLIIQQEIELAQLNQKLREQSEYINKLEAAIRFVKTHYITEETLVDFIERFGLEHLHG